MTAHHTFLDWAERTIRNACRWLRTNWKETLAAAVIVACLLFGAGCVGPVDQTEHDSFVTCAPAAPVTSVAPVEPSSPTAPGAATYCPMEED